MKKLFKLSILLISVVIGLHACEDEFDKPSYEIPSYDGPAVTHSIMQLKDSLPSDSTIKLITSDIVISGIVTGDDESGNIYKYITIQDESGAIAISINKTSLHNTYPVGQQVYVICKGLYIGYDGNDEDNSIMLGDKYDGEVGQIASIELEDYLYRNGTPTNTVATDTITSYSEIDDSLQYKLVTLKDVSFEDPGSVYASSTSSGTKRNISITGVDSGDLYAYTSSYADFANDTIPSGTGNVTGILIKYNSTWEIIIRSLDDVNGGFTPYVAPVITGDGSKTNPYTVSDAMEKQGESGVWMTGYIVGVVETGSDPFTKSFTAPFSTNSNLMIAASPTETDTLNCIIVKLPSGTIRDSLNLVDNSGNLSRQVMVYGNLDAYFGVDGLISTSAYWWPDTDTGYDPLAGAIYSESFSSSLGDFTAQSVSGTQTWTYNSSYTCAYMSGYASSTNNANEDWLISPALDLSSLTSATLTFSHAKYSSTNNTDLTVWVSTDYSSGLPSTGTWTELTIPTYPTNYTFVSSGDIDLSSYTGNTNVRIAFKYTSTSSSAGTWEMKNFVITE